MSITTLIVDDTVVYRKILSETISVFPDFEIVGTAPSGSIALKKMALSPVQMVFLDVHMPEMDGVETLRRIRQLHPATMVVMVSNVDTRNADTTVKALELGAIDFIRKPTGPDLDTNRAQLTEDIRSLLRLVNMRAIFTGKSCTVAAPPAVKTDVRHESLHATPHPFNHSNAAAIVIGVSTGGPEALGRLIPKLPGDLDVPVLVVQHMPPVFTRSLADNLCARSHMPVCEAQADEPILAGKVYIAPGGRHMIVSQSEALPLIGLTDSPPENSCRPSVDVLFRSASDCFGDRGVVAVILTGMGCDGLAGVKMLKTKNCVCLTQSESTCVVYGMPRAVDEAGLSDRSIPIDEMAGEIALLAKRKQPALF